MNKIIEHFYEVSSDKVNETRIVLLSDIHYYNKYDYFKLDAVSEHIFNLKPDYIVIAGDLLDEAYVSDLDYLLDWFKNLSKNVKIMVSLGNHDLFVDNNEEGFDRTFYQKLESIHNVKVLDNNSYIENNICFLGLTLPISYYYEFKESAEQLVNYMNSTFLKIDDNHLNVLVCHTPLRIFRKDVLERINISKQLELILSGHTHGGITPEFLKPILKNIGFISPLRKLFFKGAYGKIKTGNTNIIISSGITKASHRNKFHKLDPLFAREITVIDIKKTKTNNYLK